MAAFARSRLLVLLLASASLSVALIAGCRGVLGIEEREFDASLADGGADADGATDPLSCDAYCDLIMSVCTGENLQYGSREACLGLCSSILLGTLDDQTGNTIGCRINTIESSMAMIEQSDCAAGGPGGNGVCGENCVSLCESMMTVCPDNYTSVTACTTDCNTLKNCPTYHVDPKVTPDNPSIQCRLFHLSSASLGILDPPDTGLAASQIKHCPHAMGVIECLKMDEPVTCP